MAQAAWQGYGAAQAQATHPGFPGQARPPAGFPQAGKGMAPGQAMQGQGLMAGKRPVPGQGAEQGPMKMQRPAGYPGGPVAGQPGMAPNPAAQAQAAQQQAMQQPQPPAKETYVVTTSGKDTDEVVVRTLVGEYVEKGVNHGRKVYMKIHDKAIPDYVDVLLYYWDSRDGPGFEGWWFGNKLGGTQVWSHCKDSGLLPPGAGWKIPWDGPIRQTLVVRNKEALMKEESEGKLQILADEINRAEAEVSNAMDQAKGASAAGTTAGFQEAEQLLAPQVPVLQELVKKVQDSQRFAFGDAAKAFQHLSNTIRTLHETVVNECSSMRTSKQKFEQDQKLKVMEDRDNKILDELLPEATDKTNLAEDMVEKTVIASEMISSCGDDPQMVRTSIEETEKSAKAAQATIGEARIYLNAKIASTRRFTDKVRDRATAELGKLQQQLQEAQNKLNPLKTVRQDYNQRKEAQKMVAEVEEKIVLAEVDVDRAEEMVSLLNTDAPTKDGLAQASTSLQVAENHINKAMQLFDMRKSSASGAGLEEISKLGPRGEAGRARIAELRTALKAAGERASTEGYVEEAAQKLLAVTDALAKVEESEARFQDGAEEDLPLEEVLTTVKASESAAAVAQTASSMARMFIQMKVLEVKRFSSGPATEATNKLMDFQKQLEEAMKKLGELKGVVGKRKRMALVKEAETRVAKAEALVEKVKEAAAVFADDSQLMELSAEEIRTASEKTTVCEKEANEALMEVRKFVTARQIESKGKDASVEVSTELIKFQTRLSTAQTEVGKQRKLFTSVEQRLAVKKLLDEAEKKLKESEEKAAKATESVAALDGISTEAKEEGDKCVKEAELQVQEAQISARTTARFLEAQSRTQGFAKEGIGRLEPRMKACNERIQAASAQIKERSEKMFVKGILTEAEGKVKEVEAALKKAEDAETPLKGETDSKAAAGALADFEKAVHAAQNVSNGTKTAISMKRLAVKRLSEGAMQSANAELTKMQTIVDGTIKKLTEMRGRAAELKRSALRREAKGGGKGSRS